MKKSENMIHLGLRPSLTTPVLLFCAGFVQDFVAGFQEWLQEWPGMTQKILHRNPARIQEKLCSLGGGWNFFSFSWISKQDLCRIPPPHIPKLYLKNWQTTLSQQNNFSAGFWQNKVDGQKFCNNPAEQKHKIQLSWERVLGPLSQRLFCCFVQDSCRIRAGFCCRISRMTPRMTQNDSKNPASKSCMNSVETTPRRD